MKLIRTIIFAALIAFTAFSVLKATEMPNILLIIADDMGADVMPGYEIGTNLPDTPNLNKLAQNGLSFTNVWATPVCSSSRASLITGKYGINNGVNTVPGILSTDHISIFKELDNRTGGSYSSCLVGKWHLGKERNYDHPNEHGVDEFMGIMGAGVSDYYKWNKVESQSVDTCFQYATAYFTDFAKDWINKQNQPWIMWLAHVSPHTPYHSPPAGTFTKQDEGTPNMKKYLSMIENLDYEIGRLLDSIPDNVLENTMIIFIGDNGTPGNVLQGYTIGKGSLYQGGIHVPMIISGKGVSRKNQTEDAMINICDLYATIVQMADASVGERGGLYNSLSFNHLLSDSVGATRKFNYMELGKNKTFSHDAYTIRNLQYKLIHYIDSVQVFYDLMVDPYETNNLLLGDMSSEQQEVKSRLEQEALEIRTGWSCQDGIQNGDETAIDCGGKCNDCTTNAVPESNTDHQIAVYPNPFVDRIFIEHNLQCSDMEVHLFNAVGQPVNMSYSVINNNITIETYNLSEGLYIVSFADPMTNNRIFRKIYKMN